MKYISLTKGKYAIVDDEDYPLLSKFNWYASGPKKNGKFYAVRDVDNKHVHMHRIIMSVPNDLEIDHRDGNGLNNQKDNLRYSTRLGNVANIGLRRNNTSGFKGVSFNRKSGKWTAQVGIDGKNIYLGRFSSMEEAAETYDSIVKDLYGDFAWLNSEHTSPKIEESWIAVSIQKPPFRARNKPGFKGVYYRKSRKKWRAELRVNKKQIHLGLFNTAEEAALAYDNKAKELFGNVIGLNFPD